MRNCIEDPREMIMEAKQRNEKSRKSVAAAEAQRDHDWTQIISAADICNFKLQKKTIASHDRLLRANANLFRIDLA